MIGGSDPHCVCCKSELSLLTATQKQSNSNLGSVETACVLLVGGPTASHTRSVTKKTIRFLSNWHLLMSSVSLSISISPPTESAHVSLFECLLLATHNQLRQMVKGVTLLYEECYLVALATCPKKSEIKTSLGSEFQFESSNTCSSIYRPCNQGILKSKQKIGQTNLVLVQVRACVSRAKVQTHSYRSLNLPNLKHLSVLSVIKRQDSQSSEVLLVENIAFMSGVRQMTPFG